MEDSIEVLERRIERLRVAVRRALIGGDRSRARALRAELREAESAWDAALARLEADSPEQEDAQAGHARRAGHAGRAPMRSDVAPAVSGAMSGVSPHATEPPMGPSGGLLPLREQVHQALTLLTVPAAPRLVTATHEAFFATKIVAARLTSLRRDEERSFRTAPYARPYYVCAALTAELLAPARGLLAVSTWPVERRVIGPLSPRVDFLTAAIQVAEGILRLPAPGEAAMRLLWRFAANIPGAAERREAVDPRTVADAARAEREVHAQADQEVRHAAAARVRQRLDDAQQLFGSRLQANPRTGTA